MTQRHRKRRALTRSTFAALALAAGLAQPNARAADHADSPSAIADPTADIADVYAWMSADTNKLNLVMTTSPFATGASAFSPDTQYAFHIASSAGYGMSAIDAMVICQFYSESQIECWAEGEYVEGMPSTSVGITSDSGMLRVFAGLRDDPFYMELTGFQETVATVIAAAPSLSFDENSCPALDAETSDALVSQLQSGVDGAEASDTLAGANVLALVVQIDASLVNQGGPVLAVWGSTHNGQQ